MRYVRERMASGVGREHVQTLGDYVRTVVTTVEGVCRDHRTRPSELPRPSRQAYEYLAHLVASGASPTVRPGRSPRPAVRVPGIVRTTEAILTEMSDRLAAQSPASAVAAFAGRIREAMLKIEQACQKRGATAVGLPVPSRRAYAMLAFLSNDDALLRYAETVGTLRADCESTFAHGSSPKPILRIRLDDQSGVYRYRRRREEWLLRLNPGFIAADREMLQLVAREVFERGRQGRRGTIHAFVHSEEFASIGQELEDLVAGEPRTKGTVYDLTEVCKHVRHHHFSPPVGCPSSLTWTDGLTFHTFGHYNSLRDRITISRSLDDENVPRYVVEFVMYHELLHKLHGIGWATSRRAMHTPAFRADEKGLPRYEQAQEFLNRLALRLRRRLR